MEGLKKQGNEALRTGNVDEAVKFYSQAIELDHSNHLVYSNRSAAFCKQKKYMDALGDAEKAIMLKPDWGKVGQV